MKVCLVSVGGDGLSVLLRIQEAGHNCVMWCKKAPSVLGRGFVERAVSWRKHLNSDLFLFDMVGLGHIADRLRRMGKTVLGGGVVNDKIELDRDYGHDLMKEYGIPTPDYWEFNTKEEVQNFLRSKRGRYVLKPSGNQPTMFTYVAQDENSEDLREYLSSLDLKGPFVLEKFVEGVEVSTEGWFDGEKFVLPINHTFEEKKFMEGDKGGNTGCMGSVVWVCDRDKLFESTLGKLEPFLRRVGYVGPLDINCIVADKPYGLEFTARFGYNAIQVLLEGFLPGEDLGYVLWRFATRNLDTLPIGSDWLVAVRLSIPPWPWVDEPRILKELCYGVPVLYPEDASPHIWWDDVFREGRSVKCAGGDGVICSVSARGRSLREALRRVYRTIGNIRVPNLQYRSDIGKRVPEDFDTLVSGGWVERREV